MGNIRNSIDKIDAQIAALLLLRRNYSRTVQALKIEAGHSRVDLARERQIIDNYVSALGPDGAGLAHQVLLFSKGN